jgi:hypothetical protein
VSLLREDQRAVYDDSAPSVPAEVGIVADNCVLLGANGGANL